MAKRADRMGWFEGQKPIITRNGIKNKAPIHHGVAIKKSLKHVLRVAMVRRSRTQRKPRGFWSHESLIKELQELTLKLGHFPTQQELTESNRQDLIGAMRQHGGLDKIRLALGHKPTQKQRGYWIYDKIINELIKLIAELGHFPTQQELTEINRQDLISAITRHGGLWQFRNELGYESSFQSYISEINTYIRARGNKTERIVKEILIEWANINNLPEPKYNKKIADGNVIEFVCGGSRTIGIDVTNTKHPSGNTIRNKYRKKDYHKYVDELWIVVFSNVFTKRDYHKFNEESPANVRVMPIDIFLKELDISTDEHIASKIDAYKNCTFRTKDEFVKRHLNRSIDDYI